MGGGRRLAAISGGLGGDVLELTFGRPSGSGDLWIVSGLGSW